MSKLNNPIRLIAAAVAAVVAALQSTTVHAVLTDNLTIGNAKAVGLGHAVTADPPGIDSIHYNPAGLTRLKGTQTEVKVISGAFDLEVEIGDDYTPTWTKKLEEAQAGSPEGYTFDEARGKTSSTSGVSVMLPIAGMTEIPVLLAAIGGVSYTPPQSKLSFGTNVYAPLAVGFSREDDDPGRFIGQALSFTMLTYFSPSVAYQYSDTLSLGASVTFNYAGVGLDLSFREPNLGLQWLEKIRQDSCYQDENGLDGAFSFNDLLPCVPESESLRLYEPMAYLELEVEKPLTFGLNVGALWEATPWLHFGAVYHAPVPMDMEGDFMWTQGDGFLHFLKEFDKISPIPFSKLGPLASLIEPVTRGKVKLDMNMPDHMAFGTSVQVTPRFKVNTDLKFTRWSDWDSLLIEYGKPLGVLLVTSFIQPDAAPPPAGQTMVLPFGLEDTWNLALGFEYQVSDRLALRFGIEDRPSSIPKDSRSPVLPINDAKFYSVGAEFKPNSTQVFNFAVATMKSETYMPGNTSIVGNSEDPAKLIYNPYSGSDLTATLDAVLLEASYRYVW